MGGRPGHTGAAAHFIYRKVLDDITEDHDQVCENGRES